MKTGKKFYEKSNFKEFVSNITYDDLEISYNDVTKNMRLLDKCHEYYSKNFFATGYHFCRNHQQLDHPTRPCDSNNDWNCKYHRNSTPPSCSPDF